MHYGGGRVARSKSEVKAMRVTVLLLGIALFIGCSRSKKQVSVGEKQLEYFAAQLADDDPTVRVQARFRLMDEGPPAVPHLLEALRHRSPTVRYEAASALTGMRPPPDVDAVPGLTKALDDPDPLVRGHCLRVLCAIGPPAVDAVPAIRAALDADNDYVCSTAAYALAAIQRTEAIPELTKSLSRPRAAIAAATALGEFGRDAQPAVPQLQELAQTGNTGAKRAATESLNRILNVTPK
jgi:HEAT repeat protein